MHVGHAAPPRDSMAWEGGRGNVRLLGHGIDGVIVARDRQHFNEVETTGSTILRYDGPCGNHCIIMP